MSGNGMEKREKSVKKYKELPIAGKIDGAKLRKVSNEFCIHLSLCTKKLACMRNKSMLEWGKGYQYGMLDE